MQKPVLLKSVDVCAPREKVWEVLLQDRHTRQWLGNFGEGASAESDWKVGSKARFVDGAGTGVVSRITENQPASLLAMTHEGVIMNGKEEYDSEEAGQWRGLEESFELSERKGVTTLTIEQELPDMDKEAVSDMWDKALEEIKKLAEAKS